MNDGDGKEELGRKRSRRRTLPVRRLPSGRSAVGDLDGCKLVILVVVAAMR